MGKHKDEGDSVLALAEECSEVIQVITKKYRFDGDWDEIQPGTSKTRLELLTEEMEDVVYQWERVKNILRVPIRKAGPKRLSEVSVDKLQWECHYGTLHTGDEECHCNE